MAGASIRGETLALRRDGSGDEHLVLVHGFQNDASVWQPFVDRLDLDRFTVTRFDLAGCGASSRPAAAARCTIDEYAQDLLAVCDHAGLERPVAIGHSLGGGTVLRAALDRPGAFRAMVLVAPVSTSGLDFLPPERFGTLSRPTRDEQMALGRAAFRHPPTDAELEALMAVIDRASPEHIEGAAVSMRDFVVAAELAALDGRVLLVCGDRDSHVPLRNHLATWQAIRRCGLQVYFDVGHVPFQEVPERFTQDVVRFVDAGGADR
jgi:pimeloyl-ACP methyl ester carboxylesterase